MNQKPSLSRRKFAAIACRHPGCRHRARSAAAARGRAESQYQPSAGAETPGHGGRHPALQGSDSVHAQGRRRQGPAIPHDAGAAAAVRVSGCGGVESRLHESLAGGPAAAQLPPECGTAVERGAARRVGDLRGPDAGRAAQQRRRTARPLHRTLPFGQRAALRLHGRQGSQSQGRLHGGGTGQMPAEARRERLPERVSHRVVRPAGRAQAGVGAVLHHPQDHGRHARHVPTGRQQAGARSSRRHVAVGRRVVRVEDRRAHAGHSEHRIRRHERGALQSGRRHRQRPLGQGRRPLHQEALLQSAGAAQRRADRTAREHAHSRR